MKLARDRLTSLTTWDTLEMYFFALFWGLWTLVKLAFKKFWQKQVEIERRGNPPACLTDVSVGQHLYIKLKGVKLHYVEAGEKDKPLLLLLHGFPDCWITWRYQIPELSKYFRVVAVDLKGFGDSDKPVSRTSYRIKKLTDELCELVRSLGHDRCTVIGHDIGGLLGWYLVHLYPEFVTRFVALASPHPNLYWNSIPDSSLFNSRWVQICQLPYLPEYQALEDLDIINRCYQHLSTNAGSRCYLDSYKYTFSREDDWTGPINYFRNLPFWRMDCGDNKTMVPCLLMIGNKDSSVLMENVIKSAEYVEKYSLKVIEGAGHFLHQQRPNEVNKQIIKFLIDEPVVVVEMKPVSAGLVNKVFEAGSFAMNVGNTMLSAVQKKTNGLTSKVLYMGQSSI